MTGDVGDMMTGEDGEMIERAGEPDRDLGVAKGSAVAGGGLGSEFCLGGRVCCVMLVRLVMLVRVVMLEARFWLVDLV